MLERAHARSPLQLEPEPRLITNEIRRVARYLGQRGVQVVVLFGANLDVVLGIGRRVAIVQRRRGIEIDGRYIVMGIGQAVGPRAGEAMKR